MKTNISEPILPKNPLYQEISKGSVLATIIVLGTISLICGLLKSKKCSREKEDPPNYEKSYI